VAALTWRHIAIRMEQHIIGTESDFSAGRAWGVTAQASDAGQDVVDQISQLLASIGIARGDMDTSASGPDLTPLVKAGLPSFRFTQYGMDFFDLHHTPDDTLDKIEPAALDQNTAAFAVFAWLGANSSVDFRRRP
jgi:carboxypeptidase Q